MTSINTVVARQFLNFFGGDQIPHQWQLIHDKKKDEFPTSFYDTFDNALPRLEKAQAEGYGVFITLNETDGRGHGKDNIIDYRMNFADIDGGELPTNIPNIPHLIYKRDDLHYHIFFPNTGLTTHEQYEKSQTRIWIHFDSDHQVTDPSRVVRLAGSLHQKGDTPAMYTLYKDMVTMWGGAKTDYEGFERAFPLNPEQAALYESKTAPQKTYEFGDGFNTEPVYRQRFIKWLSEYAEPAVKGNNRSHQVLRVNAMGRDLGIPLAEAQELSWQYYNPRIIPPYTEAERQVKHDTYVMRGYKYGNNQTGCRTVAGIFGEAIGEGKVSYQVADNYVPPKKDEAVKFEPVTDDAANEGEYRRGISEQHAAALRTTLTSKSNINDLAQAFVGYNFPDGGLIRNNRAFYSYNGKFWQREDSDDVRSWIFKEYGESNLKLPPSKISNILTAVEDTCQTKNIKNNHWLDGREQDKEETTVVVKNGLLKITKDSVELMPHSNEFFSLNCLPFEYNPDAKCPTFDNFLCDLFDDESLRKIIAEYGGYCLTSEALFQKFLLFVGKSRGGKGVLTEIFRHTLGAENTISPSINNLHKDYTLNALSRAILATVPEANNMNPRYRSELTDVIKAVSGNDPLTFDEKFNPQPITCMVWPKFIFSANEVPDFADGSGALANRTIPIPFTKSFAGREDPQLANKLKAETAGIFNLFIVGLQRLYAQGHFTHSQTSADVLTEMREDMFLLSDFVNTHLTLDKEAVASYEDVYDAYKWYCSRNNIKTPYSKIKVGKLLTSSYHDITKGKVAIGGKQIRGYVGCSVNQDSLKPKVVATVTEIPNYPAAANH